MGMGKRNNSIIISAVLVAFLVGTIFSSPNYANALPPWANEILERLGIVESDLANNVCKSDGTNCPPPSTGGSLSCENQIVIYNAIDGFSIDEDCFTGYDLGVSMEIGFTFLTLPIGESSTLTVFIENRGPDDAQDIPVFFNFNHLGYEISSDDPVCDEGGTDLVCIIESLNNGESDSLTFEILNFAAPNGILEISVTDTIIPFGTASNSVTILISE